MSDDHENPFPDVRPIRAVLTEMTALAEECGTVTDEDRIGRVYGRALSLVLEMRVPRMPDDPRDLEAMLDQSAREGDGGMTTEQVFENLDRHRAGFIRFLKDYRDAIARRDWTKASDMLLDRFSPNSDGQDIQGNARISTDGNDGCDTGATTPGLARLSALLHAHVQRMAPRATDLEPGSHAIDEK